MKKAGGMELEGPVKEAYNLIERMSDEFLI